MKKRTPDEDALIRTMLRRNASYREDKYNLGGTKKEKRTSPPVTLPKLKFMEGDDPDDGNN